MTVIIPLQKLPHGADLPLPAYATGHAAGMDLMAAVEGKLTLGSLERQLIPAGFAMALPEGYEAQVRPRSGLAFKHGVTVCNAPGTIDADYRGEVKVLLVNLSHEPFVIERGMRIAQLVIAPVTSAAWQEVSALDETQRGAGGFGSTGIKAAKP
ncbi:MAG: dUTP diphosphatase [Alphaproteobacteria bacterium]|nr:dUTP diphosphatase [Alphaproteobacteria bacterium]